MLKIESSSNFFEKDEVSHEYWEENKSIIEKTISTIEQKLGEGNTSEVFFLAGNADLCIKLMKREYDGTFHIPLAKEMAFLEEIHGIDEHVSVPRPYVTAEYIDGESKVKFLLMKRLHAKTIRDILDAGEDLPEKFDVEDFRSKMEEFIDKMHAKNIYHRDLHDGNIMLSETGQISVIDFGRSGTAFGDENPYIARKDGQRIAFPSDEENLKEVCLRLKRYLLTR